MWFAVNVRPGSEADAVALLAGPAARAGVTELFCPMASFGDGRAEEPLLAGCVVAVAPSRSEVRAALRHAPGIDGFLADGPSLSGITAAEAAFLDGLTGPAGRVAPMSEGVAERGKVRVESGPLAGREHLVVRYSRRRRRALVAASVAGRSVEAALGLHVVRVPGPGDRA